MSNIIDKSYFIGGEINIAQLADQTSTVVSSTLEGIWIARYEPDYLKKALGVQFAADFVAGIAVTPTPEQRWLDILNGIVYVYDSYTYEWTGFANTLKASPIANWIYCKYMSNNATSTNGISETKAKVQNAESVSNGYKVWKASQNMVTQNRALYHYLNTHKDTYPTWNWIMVDRSMRSFAVQNPFQI